MKTDLILKFKQNLFSKVIWSSTFNCSIMKIIANTKLMPHLRLLLFIAQKHLVEVQNMSHYLLTLNNSSIVFSFSPLCFNGLVGRRPFGILDIYKYFESYITQKPLILISITEFKMKDLHCMQMDMLWSSAFPWTPFLLHFFQIKSGMEYEGSLISLFIKKPIFIR